MLKLKPQARPQALADLEVRIAQAARIRDYRYGAVSRLVAARRDPKGAQMLLKLAEERLRQLQRSREVLTGEEQADDDEAEAP
jgi:hypothetical protein